MYSSKKKSEGTHFLKKEFSKKFRRNAFLKKILQKNQKERISKKFSKKSFNA